MGLNTGSINIANKKLWSTPDNNALSFSFVSLVLFFIGIVATYIKSQYEKVPVDRLLLYTADDPGYVAGQLVDSPLVGIHRFGDFLTTLSWAKVDSPFSSSLDFPSIYGPTALWFTRLFDSGSLLLSVYALGLITTLLLAISLFILGNNISTLPRLILVISALLITKPFLLNLDRGNLQGIVVALEIFAIWSLNNNKFKTSSFLVIIAATMKFYPIALVIPFFQKKRYTYGLITLGFGILINLLGIFVLSSFNLFDGILGLLKGLSITSQLEIYGYSGSAWILRVLSFIGLNFNPEEGDFLSKILSYIVLAIFAVLLCLGIVKGRLQGSRLVVIVLSLSTVCVPVSWGYNLIWVSAAVFLLINDELWKTGITLLDHWSLFGFIPLLVLLPWEISDGPLIATGIGELWAFPFILSLLIIWMVNPYERKS